MNKKASLLFGLTLIVLGLFALAGNLLLRAAGTETMFGFRAWPILVVGAGLLFCLPPFIFPKQRGLGGLFIPGLPVLTTGILLFLTSLSGQWGWWGTLWPWEVIGVALGFVLAAIFIRVVWLMIPASIIGLNGLVLLYCAITGQWSSWAVWWTIEPFAVGLPLLLIGFFQRIEGLKLAGIILCGLAGLAFAAMSSVLVTSLWITRIVGPAILLVLGLLLVGAALFRRGPSKGPAEIPADEPAEDKA